MFISFLCQTIYIVTCRSKLPKVRRVWEDPAEISPNASSSPQHLTDMKEDLQKYFILNMINILLVSLFIPENITRLYIILNGLTCQTFSSLDGKVALFEVSSLLLYPIFVKKKLDKFKWTINGCLYNNECKCAIFSNKYIIKFEKLSSLCLEFYLKCSWLFSSLIHSLFLWNMAHVSKTNNSN